MPRFDKLAQNELEEINKTIEMVRPSSFPEEYKIYLWEFTDIRLTLWDKLLDYIKKFPAGEWNEQKKLLLRLAAIENQYYTLCTQRDIATKEAIRERNIARQRIFQLELEKLALQKELDKLTKVLNATQP